MAYVSWSQRWLRPEVRRVHRRSSLFSTLQKQKSIRGSFVQVDLFFIASRSPLFLSLSLSPNSCLRSQQILPIIGALTCAVSMCTFFCARQITSSPGFTVSKAKRTTAIPESPENYKEGDKFRNHWIRRSVKGRRPEIMPELNASMSK